MGPGAGSVESVVVAPATATVSVNANLTLTAEVLDAAGTVLPSMRVSWSSADPSIADVSQGGVVTGRKVGTVLIAASARGKDAFARITVNPTPVASVRVSPTQRSLTVGQTQQLTAEALDAAGQVFTGRPITWSSSSAAVATVTQSGLVTAVAPGAAFITATAEGKSDEASVTVSLVPVASVRVTPTSKDLVVGQTAQLSASALDANGAVLTGRAITWSSNQPTVATVTSDGLVSAISSGTATITATSEGRSASAAINVSPRPASAVIVSPSQVTIFAGQSLQLTAQVTDAVGQVIGGQSVTFSSSNSQVATVSSQGMVTGVAQGTATITATSGIVSGTATVTIAPDPVAAVEVTPASTTILVGQQAQMTATPKNVNGQPLTGRAVTWSSATPTLATVSSSGTVTGLAPGNAVITATVEGKQGSATVIVRQVPVASVTVTPSPATVSVGLTMTLTATTRDAAGNILTGRVIGWSSSDNTIATVSATGTVTGVALGSVAITATSEGQAGTAAVTVTSPPAAQAATVTVTPATLNLSVGTSSTLSASAQDASGNPMPGATFTWSSSNASVATVNSNGKVNAIAPGSATITATSGSASGTAAVTVSPGPIHHIVVTPANPHILVGQTVQLTATVYDANNNVIPGVTVTWSSADPNKATVSSTGLVTGVKKGTTVTITASAGGKNGSTSVRVD